MKNNIKIAKQLIKIAKELYASSIPQNKEFQDELIQNAINEQNYSEMLQAIIEYRNNIQNILDIYNERTEQQRKELEPLYLSAKKRVNKAESTQQKINKCDMDIIEKYNILVPDLPDINASNEEIRVKLNRLMMIGGVSDIFNAMTRLIARSVDINTCLEKHILLCDDILEPNSLFLRGIKAKQGNQKGMIKSFIEAAQSRTRLKSAVQGVIYIRENIKFNLGTLDEKLIAYSSVSNAYVQNIEELINNGIDLDTWKKMMNDPTCMYDEQKQMWIQDGKPVLDINKFKIPTTIPTKTSSIKQASFVDKIKSFFTTIKTNLNKMSKCALECLKIIIKTNKNIKEDDIKMDENINIIQDEFNEFKIFVKNIEDLA